MTRNSTVTGLKKHAHPRRQRIYSGLEKAYDLSEVGYPPRLAAQLGRVAGGERRRPCQHVPRPLVCHVRRADPRAVRPHSDRAGPKPEPPASLSRSDLPVELERTVAYLRRIAGATPGHTWIVAWAVGPTPGGGRVARSAVAAPGGTAQAGAWAAHEQDGMPCIGALFGAWPNCPTATPDAFGSFRTGALPIVAAAPTAPRDISVSPRETRKVSKMSQRTDSSQTTFVGVRAPVELVEALAQLAAARDRTLSAELRQAMRAHIGAPSDEAALPGGPVHTRAGREPDRGRT